MSKTQIKTKAMTIVDVHPRVRMKEIRAMVAKAHKQGQRIDLLGLTGDDIARSQIALQDLLTKEQNRHSKARGHIVEQKEIILALGEMMAFIGNHATESLLRDQAKIARLVTALTEERKLHHMASKAMFETLDENQTLTSELEATMNTLRVALNGSING